MRGSELVELLPRRRLLSPMAARPSGVFGPWDLAPLIRLDSALVKFAVTAEEDSPAQTLEKAELERLIAACIDRIPKVEKTVLSLYFYEELTLREIADVMQVHLSRVSQIKSQAILRLRSAIVRRWPGVRR